jgi:hypothetical protein
MEQVNKDLNMDDTSCLILVEKVIHIIEFLKKIMEEQEQCNKLLAKLYTIRKLTKCEIERLEIIKTIYRGKQKN